MCFCEYLVSLCICVSPGSGERLGWKKLTSPFRLLPLLCQLPSFKVPANHMVSSKSNIWLLVLMSGACLPDQHPSVHSVCGHSQPLINFSMGTECKKQQETERLTPCHRAHMRVYWGKGLGRGMQNLETGAEKERDRRQAGLPFMTGLNACAVVT